MFPIPRIKVESSINSVDDNGFRMIKHVENKRNGMKSRQNKALLISYSQMFATPRI